MSDRVCANPACGHLLARRPAETPWRWARRTTCGDPTCISIVKILRAGRTVHTAPVRIDAERMAQEWEHFSGFGITPTRFAARMGVSVEALVKAMRVAGPRVGGPFLAAWGRETAMRRSA